MQKRQDTKQLVIFKKQVKQKEKIEREMKTKKGRADMTYKYKMYNVSPNYFYDILTKSVCNVQ